MMTSLSPEEENYVRISLLLTGISPRAARTFFDKEFAPACLGVSLKKEYNTLLDLKKKHRINQIQWNFLFPRYPDVPDSKTFDITLMITLLRNLTSITVPLGGFDCLPSAIETSPAADLARIKYYRNYLAHLDDGNVNSAEFNTAWDDISEAIRRLGGQKIRDECDQLRTKTLDQTNKEIIMHIKRSNYEIVELKGSLDSLKKSQAELKENHAEITKEVQRLKICQDDTVPWNVRAIIKNTLKSWIENDEKMFVETSAAKQVFKCIRDNSCVTITASSGVGKTSILRHVALQMAKNGYDIILVSDPGDIVKFYNPDKKTLFVVDDLCGNFSVNHCDIKNWEPVINDIKKIIGRNQTKLIAACRLQIFKDIKFEPLKIFKLCVCNLLSDKMCLSKREKQMIAKLYLKTKAHEISDYYNIYDCFPLLCKLYHDNPQLIVTDFFQNPFSVYESEIYNLIQKGHYTKYCALALCVVFNNRLKVEILIEDVKRDIRTIIENTCEACRLDRGTSRLVLQDELDSLKDTFVKKDKNMYTTIHDKLFDFLAFFYGQQLVKCLIKNADSGLIKERFLLDRNDDMDQFITIIPTKYHQMYIQRIIDDLSKGRIQDVFSNINMKIPQFRQKLLFHMKLLDTYDQKRLAHTFEACEGSLENTNDLNDTVLIQCCLLGDLSLVQWCCYLNVDVNKCGYYGRSPITSACTQGHIEIVKLLLDQGADYDKCDADKRSPIMMACEHGYCDIVKMLLHKGAVCNTYDISDQSPLMIACEHGHTEIVEMLLQKEVDYNKCEKRVSSPLMIACRHGHKEIVEMLILRGADYNKTERWGLSPLMIACQNSHVEIVKMLLDREAKFKNCTISRLPTIEKIWEHGHKKMVETLLDLPLKGGVYHKYELLERSYLMTGCELGYTQLVEMMLDKGVDYDRCEKWGWSPLMMAYKNDHIEIVKILLDRGAEFDKPDRIGQSLIMLACGQGHIDIVKMLLDRGVNFDKCNRYGQSPLMKACEQGHKEIVHVLLERGANCNRRDKSGQSPLIKACEYGHTEIIEMLLDRGADIYCSDDDGRFPVDVAYKQGYQEITKMLLDRGVDFNRCNGCDQSPIMNACEQDL